MGFTTLSDVDPLCGSSEQAVFVCYVFFLTFVEGYCLIYVRCTWHSGASKEALACIADKKTKFIPVRMSCRTLYLARMGKWYHLLLLTLPLKQLQLFLCMS